MRRPSGPRLVVDILAGAESLVIEVGFSVLSTSPSIIIAAFIELQTRRWQPAAHFGLCAFFQFLLLRLLRFVESDSRRWYAGCPAEGLRVSVHGLADNGVAWVAEDEVLGRPSHRRELDEAGIEFGLVETGGVELLIEPFVEAHGADGIQVTGPRSKCEAIEGMEYAIVASQLAGLICGTRPGPARCLIWLDRGRDCAKAPASVVEPRRPRIRSEASGPWRSCIECLPDSIGCRGIIRAARCPVSKDSNFCRKLWSVVTESASYARPLSKKAPEAHFVLY